MNGAESLIRTALAAGVDTWFANPGTTEITLVAAADVVKGVRMVLALFEGVCSGAADGYARMSGKPAVTLTHLGPGFANSIANLHNARRARSPIVNVIGNHATWHLPYDAPLTSDIESLARPVSAWVRESKTPSAVANDMAEAVAAAWRIPGQIATLIVPSDCQWSECNGVATPLKAPPPDRASDAAVKRSAEMLRKYGAKAVLFIGGQAFSEHGLRTAGRIVAKTQCRLLCETFMARIERGGAVPTSERLPYFPEMALESLSRSGAMVIAGARAPVAFFGYPSTSSSLIPPAMPVETLANPLQDVVAALEALAQGLGAPRDVNVAPRRQRPPRPTGKLSPETIGLALSALMPEGAIVVDEAATTGMPFYNSSDSSPAHTYMTVTGGAIGQGMPCATGAAIACPDRKVISFQADGSGMYTLQALWTQAREQLNVTTLICNNRRYRILQVELARAGITEPGPKARALTSLNNPEINFSRIAAGFGIPAVRVESADDLATQLDRALGEPGPNMIEMLL